MAPTKHLILLFFTLIHLSGYTQNFLNGSFENNTAFNNVINPTNAQFNAFMSNCIAFGPAGNIDIVTNLAGAPQHGNWYVGLHESVEDLMSLELSSNLALGKVYVLSFYHLRSLSNPSLPFKIGLSDVANDTGNVIYIHPTNSPTFWKKEEVAFFPPSNDKYVTVWIPSIFNCYTNFDNFNILPFSIGNDTTICKGDSLILDATLPNATYFWDDSTTLNNRSITEAGTFWIDITIDNQTYRDSINIKHHPHLTNFLGADTILCQGDTLNMDLSSLNGTFMWNDGTNLKQKKVHQSGNYSLTITSSSNPCPSSDTVNVSFETPPVVNLGPDKQLCIGDTVFLKLTNQNTKVNWPDGSRKSTFPVYSTGHYWASSRIGKCEARDSIYLSFDPKPKLNLGEDTTLCKGDSIRLNAKSPYGKSYLWQDADTNSSKFVNLSDTYVVNINPFGCSVSDTITISFVAPPELELGLDTIICNTDSIYLDASSQINLSFKWQNGSSDFYQFATKGIYAVTVSSKYCGDVQDSISVETKECNCEVYIPNAFSPNEDYINPIFKPIATCELIDFQLYIYDRWGNEVFYSDNLSIGWDGKFKGHKATKGIYGYYFRFKTIKGSFQEETGAVTLIR